MSSRGYCVRPTYPPPYTVYAWSDQLKGWMVVGTFYSRTKAQELLDFYERFTDYPARCAGW
jgi:hypothetical protein